MEQSCPRAKGTRSGSRVALGGRLWGEGDRPSASEPPSAPLKKLGEEFCVGSVVFKDDISWCVQKQGGFVAVGLGAGLQRAGVQEPLLPPIITERICQVGLYQEERERGERRSRFPTIAGSDATYLHGTNCKCLWHHSLAWVYLLEGMRAFSSSPAGTGIAVSIPGGRKIGSVWMLLVDQAAGASSPTPARGPRAPVVGTCSPPGSSSPSTALK